jgi:hypothetical protein
LGSELFATVNIFFYTNLLSWLILYQVLRFHRRLLGDQLHLTSLVLVDPTTPHSVPTPSIGGNTVLPRLHSLKQLMIKSRRTGSEKVLDVLMRWTRLPLYPDLRISGVATTESEVSIRSTPFSWIQTLAANNIMPHKLAVADDSDAQRLATVR